MALNSSRGGATLDGGPMATRAAIPTTVALKTDCLMINCPLARLRNLATLRQKIAENTILKSVQSPRNTKYVTKFFSHAGGLFLHYV